MVPVHSLSLYSFFLKLGRVICRENQSGPQFFLYWFMAASPRYNYSEERWRKEVTHLLLVVLSCLHVQVQVTTPEVVREL